MNGSFRPVRRPGSSGGEERHDFRQLAEAQGGDAVLPADSVTWSFVGSIQLRRTRRNTASRTSSVPPPPVFRTICPTHRHMAVAAGQFQAVYLTIHVPSDAQAGDYEGAFNFRSDQGRQNTAAGPDGLPADASRTSGT